MNHRLFFCALLSWCVSNAVGQETSQKRSFGFVAKNVEVGVTNIDSFVARNYIPNPNHYYQGQVAYKGWERGKSPLPWNYCAELVRDNHADLSSLAGKQAQSRFVPGYRILWMDGFGATQGLEHYGNVEMLFKDNILISFLADVDSVQFKRETYYHGAPLLKNTVDTVSCGEALLDKPIIIFLHKGQYAWSEGNQKVEVINFEVLDKKCFKKNAATLHVFDKVRYDEYVKAMRQYEKQLAK